MEVDSVDGTANEIDCSLSKGLGMNCLVASDKVLTVMKAPSTSTLGDAAIFSEFEDIMEWFADKVNDSRRGEQYALWLREWWKDAL